MLLIFYSCINVYTTALLHFDFFVATSHSTFVRASKDRAGAL